MKLIFISLLISISASYTFAALTTGKCIGPNVIPDFDATKYVGKWYEINRVDYLFEKNLECVTAEYGLVNGTTVTVRNGGRNVNSGKYDYVNGYAYVSDPSVPNRLTVVLPIEIAGTTLFQNSADYRVWETDYNQYSVVYSCTQVIPNLLKYEIVWILSRGKTLDQTVLNNLRDRVKSRGVNLNSLINVNQSCDN